MHRNVVPAEQQQNNIDDCEGRKPELKRQVFGFMPKPVHADGRPNGAANDGNSPQRGLGNSILPLFRLLFVAVHDVYSDDVNEKSV